MLATLLPGLRGLRSTLASGAIIVASLYVFFGGGGIETINVRKPARDLVSLSPGMPLVLVTLLCLLIGSLYSTALEGLVDWIHRRTAPIDMRTVEPGLKRTVLRPFAPLSDSARARLVIEAERFYDEYFTSSSDPMTGVAAPTREEFVAKVIAEILWLEGKLSGTPLAAPYDQARSEGQLQLGIALLLPLATAALGYAVHFSPLGIALLTLGTSLLALKLAAYGLYYFRKAHSFLAHHVADGVLLAPSMETLRRLNADRT